MKKIGLVGGTGPESTLMYYKEINSRIDEMTGNKAMPDIAIESVNFRKAWNMVVAEDYEALADYLSEKINFLKKTGSEVISLTAVTMHIVFDLIQEKTGVSLISIPMAVCNEVKRRNYKKIGLLGTIFTMEQDYMKKDFDQVKQASETIIGIKQAVKAMRAGQVTALFVAIDADSWVVDPAILLAKEIGVPVYHVDSKKELGKACGIHVGAAVVAITAM